MSDEANTVFDQLLLQQLTIICPHIELTRQGDGHKFSGPGTIQQDGLEDFSIHIHFKGDVVELNQRIQGEAPKPGEIIPENRYYVLDAIDYWGRRWKAMFVEEFCLPGTWDGSCIVRAKCEEIILVERMRAYEPSNLIQLKSRRPFEFPCTTGTLTRTLVNEELLNSLDKWNIARFEVDSLNFDVCKEDVVSIQIKSVSPLAISVEHRVMEALAFTFGVSWETWIFVQRIDGDEKTTRFRWRDCLACL